MQRNLKQKLEGLIVIVQQQRTLLGERDVAHREAVRRCEEADDRVQALTIEVTKLMRQSSDEEKLKVELHTSNLEAMELKRVITEHQELAKVSGRGRAIMGYVGVQTKSLFDSVCLLLSPCHAIRAHVGQHGEHCGAGARGPQLAAPGRRVAAFEEP